MMKDIPHIFDEAIEWFGSDMFFSQVEEFAGGAIATLLPVASLVIGALLAYLILKKLAELVKEFW